MGGGVRQSPKKAVAPPAGPKAAQDRIAAGSAPFHWQDPAQVLRNPPAPFDVLLRSLPQGICLVDPRDAKVLFHDERVAKMFGYSDASLAGHGIDRLGTKLPAELLVAADRVFKDVECVRKDGSRILCSWTGNAMGQGPDRLWLFVVEDATIRREAESVRRESERRLEELERLRQLDQVKTQFINNAAHELKTPLTPIKVQTHLLRTVLAEGLSADQRQSIDILNRNLERLRHLVDDVLEAARLQAHKLNVRIVPLDLNPLVLETVESFKAVAAQVGVSIEWRYAEQPHVEGDRERLTQVVYNLLSNAVKFTPPGGRVSVETSRSDTEAFVRVRDTGRGMTPEQIGRLFQPFGQVHDQMQDTRAGTGLGLYISLGIIQEHNGRIWAESAGPGRGSVFAFTLPLTTQPVPAARRLAPEALTMRPPKAGRSDPALARRLRELI
jgi:PAS domain S-box-containing protein